MVRGEATGVAECAPVVLEGRGTAVAPEVRRDILAREDPAAQRACLRRAATVATAAEVTVPVTGDVSGLS